MNTEAPSPARKAEAAALGSILTDPPRIKIATKLGLQPADFTDPMLAAIYSAACESHRTRRLIDPVLLAEELRDHQLFNTVPAASIIAEVASPKNTPTSAHVEYYIEQVIEASRKRWLHGLAGELSDGALNGKPARQIIHEIGSAFDDLRRQQVAEPLLGDAVNGSQFVQQDHRIDYLIPQTIVAGQAGIISAKSKCLKTSVAIDAHVSMSTATAFLGHWRIEEPINCGILSAESGAATIAETIRRVCNSKGVDANTELSRMMVSTRCPRLRDPQWLDEIRRFIEANELRCLTIDPTYLAMAGLEQNQLSIVAEALAPISDIIRETNCTVMLVHHNRKNPASPFGPPTLDEITGTGYAEWARFWLLLNRRREWDEETGAHALWLVAGGSAGFGARKWLDVREGRQLDVGGRVWQVEVQNATDGERTEKQAQARQRDEERAAKAEERERAVVEALRQEGGQASRNRIAERLGVGKPTIATALIALQDRGDIVPCRVRIESSKRTCEGFKLNEN